MTHPNPHFADAPASASPAINAEEMLQAHAGHAVNSKGRTLALSLAALGVVYGDIGTSPLYALENSVIATGGQTPGPMAILGTVSLIFWALIVVVTLKYVLLIMRADNQGEGGVLSLATLAHRSPGLSRTAKWLIGVFAILGLALFYGDGMITPALSVLSAVEYVTVDYPRLSGIVVPATLAILIALFLYQNRGTAKIGLLFGPVMLLWFLVIGVLGLVAIIDAPQILLAFNPYYGVAIFMRDPLNGFVAMGSVVLAVTGCEALYADMGHFGKNPIRYAWLGLVLPALVLNYFGQGAAVLRHPHQASIAFFALVPEWLHLPMLILGVMATIIASQAVISGVYSITQQAVQLGQLPRMEVRHTSAIDYGQIYVPRINNYLLIGVVLIVLIFKSSAALASAYGIAVTGVMVLSTLMAGLVALRQWHWSPWIVYPLFGVLGLIDIFFFASNTIKIVEGGWLPILIAIAVFVIMETWRIGRRVHLDKIRNESMPVSLFLERAEKTPVRVAGTAVFLSARSDAIPSALLHNLKHNKVLHERVLLVHVAVEDTPVVPPERRIKVQKLGKGFFDVLIRHGFFETPDVPKSLEDARPFGLALDIETTTFFIGHESLVPAGQPALGSWRTWLYIWLAGSALSPARFYHLPPGRVVELGTQVSI